MAGEIAARYEKLATTRSTYITEAYRSAQLTIPALIPDEQDVRHRSTPVVLAKPFQSLGARGVNNLSAKLLLTLLPPTSPFFRYEISPELFEGEDPKAVEQVRTVMQQKLAQREKKVVQEVDSQGIRTKIHAALRHLVVTGNYLAYLPPEGGLEGYPLTHYVVQRDHSGTLLEFIYLVGLDRRSIEDEEIKQAIEASAVSLSTDGEPPTDDTPVWLYTRVALVDGKYVVTREVDGQRIEEEEVSFDSDNLPYLVLRFTAIDGEDYGRGFVEEYRGDLSSLEGLSKDLLFASANAAKMVGLVSPNGTTKLSQLNKAQNGEYITGQDGDVTFLKIDKNADMQVAAQFHQQLQTNLAADFLLNSSFQRRGERVTAEEIRTMAEELEDTLGGTFSILSQELQLPLAQRLEAQLIKSGGLEALPKGTVKPAIVTGLAAIGRGHDLERLRMGLGLTAEVANVVPDVVRYIRASDLIKRIWIGSGTDTDGLLKSDDEVAQEKQAEQEAAQQAQMQEAIAQGGIPELAKGAVGSLNAMAQASGAQQASPIAEE
jgi:hypothetical protein